MKTLWIAFATFAMVGAAEAQTCMRGFNGMVMCDNGFMSMGGMTMQSPPFPWPGVFIPPIPMTGVFMQTPMGGQGGGAHWSQSWTTNPDGSRTITWRNDTTGPDGRVTRETRTQVVFPDGRVCDQTGPTLECR